LRAWLNILGRAKMEVRSDVRQDDVSGGIFLFKNEFLVC
jgi:hypothetical protein